MLDRHPPSADRKIGDHARRIGVLEREKHGSEWEDVGTSGAAPGLFEVVGSIGVGANLHDDTSGSADWLRWENSFWSFSDTGGGPVIYPDPGDQDYVVFPNVAGAVWRVEFMLYVQADPQTEPISTPKLWAANFYVYEGAPGSWSLIGMAQPGLSNVSMVFQHNLDTFVAVPASLYSNQVMWARFYTWRSGSTYSDLALRVQVNQTHPRGDSTLDRQTTMAANVRIEQG